MRDRSDNPLHKERTFHHELDLAPLRMEGRKEGRKEIFYLMMHSTHFYLRLSGIRHMIKDQLDSERGNQPPSDTI